jgi:hypothetical protein
VLEPAQELSSSRPEQKPVQPMCDLVTGMILFRN